MKKLDYKILLRHSLGFFPTPIQELKRFSKSLGGPRIFIKRDDQTGLAFGGWEQNKKVRILNCSSLS